jgi:hypothetical protein
MTISVVVGIVAATTIPRMKDIQAAKIAMVIMLLTFLAIVYIAVRIDIK